MKAKIVDLAKKSHIFMTLIRKIKFIIERTKYLFYYFTNNVEENLFIFESYIGRQYSCNPKYLYLYLQNNPSYKFVWAFKEPKKYKYLESENTKIIKYGSKEYYKTYTKAKYFITNSRIPDYIIKKKNQIYIQTWHGTPLKKLGYDIKVTGGNAMNSVKDIRKKYKSDSKKYNYLLTSSTFCTKKFISAFNLQNDKIIVEEGFPRCDYLVNYSKKEVNQIKKKLNIPKNKKVILYAPTWRDNQHSSHIGYTYKNKLNLEKLTNELKDYIILFRTHYFVANNLNINNKNVIDVSNYDDVNDLYIISDLLITDYSSVFFDYAILKRPILFYMYDYSEYKNKLRDFYINIKELPGPIIKKENDLIKEIKNINSYNKNYQEKYEKFNKKYNYLHDGKATERIIKKIS